MKRMLPSLREKQRYLVFEIIDGEFSVKKVREAIWEACLQFMGENSCSDANIKFLTEFFEGKKGVIRVNRGKVGELKTSLALIRRINKRKVILKTRRLCGTINNCKEVLKEVES